ncbi:hypothetical protein AB0N81_41495 [Streptomyces sp. NPDC093510]|uniref:hypothetical protein n=1 Tax=Streptomyces sp. NPDC093510 TaxID=3155199 RepID=UPI003427ABA6
MIDALGSRALVRKPSRRVALALLWFPAVAPLVDRLGRWLRRPRAARAVEAVTGTALGALGAVLLLGPLTA